MIRFIIKYTYILKDKEIVGLFVLNMFLNAFSDILTKIMIIFK